MNSNDVWAVPTDEDFKCWIVRALQGKIAPSPEFLARFNPLTESEIQSYLEMTASTDRWDFAQEEAILAKLEGDTSAHADYLRAGLYQFCVGEKEKLSHLATARAANKGHPASCLWIVNAWLEGCTDDVAKEIIGGEVTAAGLRDMAAFVGVCAKVSKSRPQYYSDALKVFIREDDAALRTLDALADLNENIDVATTFEVAGISFCRHLFGIKRMAVLFNVLDACGLSDATGDPLPQAIMDDAMSANIRIWKLEDGFELTIDGMRLKMTSRALRTIAPSTNEHRARLKRRKGYDCYPSGLTWAANVGREAFTKAAENGG